MVPITSATSWSMLVPGEAWPRGTPPLIDRFSGFETAIAHAVEGRDVSLSARSSETDGDGVERGDGRAFRVPIRRLGPPVRHLTRSGGDVAHWRCHRRSHRSIAAIIRLSRQPASASTTTTA